MDFKQHFTEGELVLLAQSLIRIPSHKLVENAEKEVAEYIYRFCSENGLATEIIPVEGERPNVMARLSGTGGGKTLLLNGHMDTVPPYNMAFDPFEAFIKDGAIWGRGASDMKGPIAAMLIAMLAVKRSGVKLRGDVVFTGVIGEETKSEGTEYLVKSGIKADGAIVGEPSNYEYSIGHRGLEWLEIKITGRAAHSGVPELGINAIEKAAEFIERVRLEVKPKLPERTSEYTGPSVLNFGVIAGGTQPSSVADSCTIKIDRRFAPGETADSVIKELTDIMDDMAAKDPDFHAELFRDEESMLTLDHPYLLTDPEADIVQTLREKLKELIGEEPQITRKRGWTDAAMLSYYGKIPTVVYGPGKIAYSHTATERVEIQQLVDAATVYANVIASFCG